MTAHTDGILAASSFAVIYNEEVKHILTKNILILCQIEDVISQN